MVLVAVLLVGVVGTGSVASARLKKARATHPLSSTTAVTAAGCPSGRSSVHQTMTGHVSGCLQVGELDPGRHQVVLTQVFLGGNGPPVSSSPETTVNGIAPPSRRAGPAVTLTLMPDAGAPGTRVVVTGRVASPIPGHLRTFDAANLCWDGCRDGLDYQGVPVRWTSPTTFRATLVVPAAPWIEGGPDRVLPLVSGRYAVGVQCLELFSGCDDGGSEGNAVFGLNVATSPDPSWCASARSCGHLTVTPRSAPPGSVVRVTGDAPLVSVIGSDHPFVFRLEVVRGRPNGPAVRFRARGEVDIGHGALEVEAPPPWASLPPIAPLAELSAGMPSVAANPADPSQLAWCGTGTVTVAGAVGQTQFSTTAATTVLDQLGFGPLQEAPPTCYIAVPLGAATVGASAVGSAAVVAAFGVSPGGELPFFSQVALFTTDGGVSWAPVPVPPGRTADEFGGFRVQGGNLAALFMPAASRNQQLQPSVEVTADAGGTWQSARLACPPTGPCVSLGGYAPGDCAMNPTTQTLLRSTDGGGHWTVSGPPNPQVGACAASALVATSPTTEFLVDSPSPYVLTRSTDGGASWGDIALPKLAGLSAVDGFGEGSAGITLLPDGSLLVTGQRDSAYAWELLTPGATSWCPVHGVSTALQQSTEGRQIVVLGTEIWWLSNVDQPSPTAEHIDVSELSC